MANAQFNKGGILLGGNISYASSQSDAPSPGNPEPYNKSGNFSISIGKAIKENAVWGLNISYSPSSNNYYYNGGSLPVDQSNNIYSAAIFYRVYKNLGKEFYLFGEAGAGYIGTHQSTIDSYSGIKTSSSGNGGVAYVMPGLSYKVSKKFFLDLSIPNVFYVSYMKNSAGYPNSYQNSIFIVSTSLSSNPLTALAIGFRLNL